MTWWELNGCSVTMIPVPANHEEALVVIRQLLGKISVLESRLEKAEARAEKAEARAEKAEARVAELEKRLEKYEKKPNPDSGMTPPYEKPNRKKGRKKKPGRKKGHSGARRKKPEHVDNHEHHPLSCCPECGSTDVTVHETATRDRYSIHRGDPSGETDSHRAHLRARLVQELS